MQPRNIQVFDGLRITTDHIEHLQGSIHSAIGDVRDILGLGRVQRGCAVTRLAAGALQVGPGVAFDRQRRRIAIDDPVKVDVPPMSGADVRYVCLSYAQVADGEGQGQATRVWDSAHVELRPTPPSVTEDVIVLARLVPAGDADFDVRPPVDEPVAEPAPAPAPPAAEQPAPASPAPPSRSMLAITPIVVDGLGALVGPKLASAVRARLATPDGAPVFRERVATIDAHAGFPITLLATHGTLVLEYSSVSDTPSRWHAEGAMQGHVVFASPAPVQCGAGSVVADVPAAPSHTSAVMVADAVLRCAFGGTATTDSPAEQQFAQGLVASVSIAPRNGDGFGADVWLEWNGGVSETLAAWLDGAPPQLECRGTLGWIASGTGG